MSLLYKYREFSEIDSYLDEEVGILCLSRNKKIF
jgi:hypothetical protein